MNSEDVANFCAHHGEGGERIAILGDHAPRQCAGMATKGAARCAIMAE